MKKKLVSIVLLLMLVISLFSSNILVASANTNIKIGDYIQMGTYYGKPILWRCVDIDENGPLILSDKIICMKAFDARSTSGTGSHLRGYHLNSSKSVREEGSDYWADSNMRCWLNSVGNVNWKCGNPPSSSKVACGHINSSCNHGYSNEKGFLTNFSQNERNLMKSVTQKSLLNGYEYSYNTSNPRNPNYHNMGYSIDSVLQNYDTAFSELVTDTMFLLDVKQVYEVYRNSSILGENYYIGEPTAECVSNYDSPSLAIGEKYVYWLRSPNAKGLGHSVCFISSDGSVIVNMPHYVYYGVRPAFYLSDNASFSYGNGSRNNPYTLTHVPVSSVSMISPSATIKVGDTYQAMAYCMPTTATDKTLTWSTNNPLVATVNNNGVVTAKGTGKATITAKSSNGKKASCIVTVKTNTFDINTYPTTYAYKFSNYGPDFGYPDVYHIPIERYIQAGVFFVSDELTKKPVLSPKILQLYNRQWDGNCFGMSTTSILFYKNILREEKYDKDACVPYDFGSFDILEGRHNISSNKYDKLVQLIELMQVTQMLGIERPVFDIHNVVNELRQGNPVVFDMWELGRKKGHSVVIYGYTKSNDTYNFNIYDCSGFVTNFVYNNDEDYHLIYTDPFGCKYTWTEFTYCTYNTILSTLNKIKSQNINNAISLFSLRQEPTYTYIFRSAGNMTITNSLRQISTITDGEVTGEIEDIRVIPSSYLAEEPTYTIILPTDTYTIVGSGDEVITTSFADDYMSASVTAKSSTPITISSDLKEISVDTAIGEEYDITYTAYDNIFDEMTLSGTATGTVTSTFNDTDITITGISALTASASVSGSVVSANSGSLSDSDEITVKCEEADSGATIQILSADAELTDKTSLPERLTVAAPTYDLTSGTYTEGQVLNFTKDDETIIYYTTDGSIPSADNGIIYSLPIDINKSMTVKAISTKYGYLDSEIVELNYTLPEVDMPQANVESGEYDKVITVELSTSDYDDTIYYTLDGSSPLENGILYTVPINISEDTYLQAYTLRNGCISEISEYEYIVAPTYPFYFSNSLTNQDGEIITLDNIADVTKVKLTLSKLHTGDHTGVFLIAFYDSDNRLIYVNSKSATINEDIDEVEMDITEDVSYACKVKAFALKDLSNIQSICEAMEENIIIE